MGTTHFHHRLHWPCIFIPSPELASFELLNLLGKTTVLFELDSLDHVPVLESIEAYVAEDCQPIPATLVPRLTEYHTHQQSPNSTGSISEHNSVIGKWNDHWDLPRLRRLYLDGPPSWVCSLRWLENCPSPKTIHLTTRCDNLSTLKVDRDRAVSEQQEEPLARFTVSEGPHECH